MRAAGVYQALPDGADGSSKLLSPPAVVRVPSSPQAVVRFQSSPQASVRVPSVQQAGSMSTPLVQLSGGNAQKAGSMPTPLVQLSGGNAQKTILGASTVCMSSLQHSVPPSVPPSPSVASRAVATPSSSLTAPAFVPVPRQYSGTSRDLAVDPPRLGSSYRLTTPSVEPTVIPPGSASLAKSQPGPAALETVHCKNCQVLIPTSATFCYSCGSRISSNDIDGKSAPVRPLSFGSPRSVSATDQFNQRIQKVQQGELDAATAIDSPSTKDDGAWLKSVEDGYLRNLGKVMSDRALKDGYLRNLGKVMSDRALREAASKTFREDKSQLVSDKVVPRYDSSPGSSAVTTTPRGTSALSSRSVTSSLNSSLAISPTRLQSDGSTAQTPLSSASTRTQQSRKSKRSSSVPPRSDSTWTYPAGKHSTPTSARDSKPHADRFKKYLSQRRGSTDERVDAAAQRQELLKSAVDLPCGADSPSTKELLQSVLDLPCGADRGLSLRTIHGIHGTPPTSGHRDSTTHADKFEKYLSQQRGSADERVDAAAHRQELLKVVRDDADGSSPVAKNSLLAQSQAKSRASGGRCETLYQDALERHRRFHERVTKFLEQTDDEINGVGERTRQQVAKNQKRVPGKSQHGRSKSPGLLARKEKRCSQVLEDAQLKELKEDAECSFQPTLITSGISGSRRDSTKALVLTTSDCESDLETPRAKGGTKGGTTRIHRSKSAGAASRNLPVSRVDSKASYESQSLSQVRRVFSTGSQVYGVSSFYEDEQQTKRQVV